MDGFGKKLDKSGRDAALPARPIDAIATQAASQTVALGAQVIESHYAARRWALRSQAARPFIHLLCVNSGTGSVIDGETVAQLRGPVMAWLPAGCAEQLEIGAGSTAHLLRLPSDHWHHHLPSSAEPAHQVLAGASEVLAFPIDERLAAVVSHSVTSIAAEIAAPARSAASAIISSELTLCILRFWRLFADDPSVEIQGSRADLLGRFRRVVEERYHQQLRVADYARLLGVTPDRLHAVCSRTLQRSPSELIQQRILQEAAIRLETSSTTVKQIAFALGFKDTAYFSRFFAKHTGEAPGAWRRMVAARGKAGRQKHVLDFADWP